MSESETWKAQIKQLNSPTGTMTEEKLKTIEFILGGSSANSQAATKQTCLVLQLQVAV